MESAVSFYDRVPNRFTRTSIAPHETMDFSLGSMPLEYPYPPPPSQLSLESSIDEPSSFSSSKYKDSISLVDPSIERKRKNFFRTRAINFPEKMILRRELTIRLKRLIYLRFILRATIKGVENRVD